ncbi:MAG: serine hydrolase domain-containing protein [Hyphomicrobium sp.]
MRNWFGILLAGLLAGAAPDAGITPWSKVRTDAATAVIQRFIDGHLKRNPTDSPGFSVALGMDGLPVWERGFGETSPGVAAEPRSVYRIGSLTKQFTAAALLLLIESKAEGWLTGRPFGLDDPVTNVLGPARGWEVAGQRAITARSLLNMVSNLPNFTRRPPKGRDPWGPIPAAELIGLLKETQPSGWPASFEYSNTSYFLLSAVIEALRLPEESVPRDYHATLETLVIARAGLKSTGFAGRMSEAQPVAAGQPRRRPAFMQPDWLKGSGDMVSTATDLRDWNRELMAGRIISPAMLGEMFADGGRVSPTVYYGMGWYVSAANGWDHYLHTGAIPGYTSCNAIALNPKTGKWISASILTNGDEVEGLDQLTEDLLELAKSTLAPVQN